MAKSLVKKPSVKRAVGILRTAAAVQPRQPSPFPLVRLQYPRHGVGVPTNRVVHVIEATDAVLRGFELENENDPNPGQYKTFDRRKVVGDVVFIRLDPVIE